MHATINYRGGRSRRQGSHRYVYTGSILETCNWCRCMSILSFALSGLSALCGIMLTVFGSTDFFRTAELNSSLIIVGVVLLVMALVLIALGFAFSRKVQQQSIEHSPQVPSVDQQN